MKLSYWEKKSFLSDIDLAVIGSGIVGLSTAIEAKRLNPKQKVVVFERGILPSGASTKNAGFACFGSPSELIDDLSHMSEDEVFNLVEKRWKGLLNLQELLGKDQIGLEQFGGYELFTSSDQELFAQCAERLAFLNSRLKGIFNDTVFNLSDEKIKSFGFQGIDHIIANNFEAQINTGEMMRSLIKLAIQEGVILLNSFPVERIEHDGNVPLLIGNQEEVKAVKVVIATNGFARQFLDELDVQPARAQVLITTPVENLKVKGTFHYDRGFYYFRNVGNRVLFGGGRNLDEKGETTTDLGLTDLIQNELKRLLKDVILPGSSFEIDQAWSGIMGVGDKKSVIIREVQPNVICAVRMGGMGVAIGSLIGKEAAEFTGC